MKKNKEWLKEEAYKLIEGYTSFGGHKQTFITGGNVNKLGILIDQLDEPEKPVIPQFVSDWIEDYRDHGGVIVDMLGSLTTGLDSVSSFDNEVAQWFRENTEKMLKALMDGYEVEKEKKYRVRAGNRYVRFNLDGSIIGVKKDNSIVCLERLSKLPFDYKKAVESGIITLEEVTQ